MFYSTFFLLFAVSWIRSILADDYNLNVISVSVKKSSNLAPSSVSSVWCDEHNKLYFADKSDGRIYNSIKVGSTSIQTQLYSSQSYNDLLSITGDDSDKLYVLDDYEIKASTATSQTSQLGSDSNSISLMDATSIYLEEPQYIFANSNGDIYFTLRFDGQFYKVNPSTNKLTMVAGSIYPGYYGDEGPALAGRLNPMTGIYSDSNGDIYIADSTNYVIRKITSSTGFLSTFAGIFGTGQCSGDYGQATSATLSYSFGISGDSNGNIYIADAVYNKIRKINAKGIITTIAGTGVAGSSGDGGAATSATIYEPLNIYVDSTGHLFLTDLNVNTVRVIDLSSGFISTFAGNGYSGYFGDGDVATSASLNHPLGLSGDSNGNIYIADSYNQRVRKVTTATKIITTVAGNGSVSISGTEGNDGPATSTGLYRPSYISVDTSGNLFLTTSDFIRRVDHSSGKITTVAGVTYESTSPTATYVTNYYDISQYSPYDSIIDSSGNIYFTSHGQHLIFKVNSDGIVSHLAGTGTHGYSGDGSAATSANLYEPKGLFMNSVGDIYFSDSYNHIIRKISASSGIITTIVGTPETSGFSGDNSQATSALLNFPVGIHIDTLGQIYIADSSNNRIRLVNSNGIINTIAGIDTYGYNSSITEATSTPLYTPLGVYVDTSSNVYISDSNNHVIRKITTGTGIISTIFGIPTIFGYSGDGGKATSTSLWYPNDIWMNSVGDLFVADSYNYRIRKMTHSSTVVSTVAGNGDYGTISNTDGQNGPATSAVIRYPTSVHGDTNGNIYLTSPDNCIIRKVSLSTGIITYADFKTYVVYNPLLLNPLAVYIDPSTENMYVSDGIMHSIITYTANDPSIAYLFAGNMSCGSQGDGLYAAGASLCYPSSMVASTSSSGSVFYIADTYNNKIRMVSSNIITTLVGTGVPGDIGDDVNQANALLYYPTNIALSNNNLYISDTGNNKIRIFYLDTKHLHTIITASSWTSNNMVVSGTLVLYTNYNDKLYLHDDVNFFTATPDSNSNTGPDAQTLSIAITIPFFFVCLVAAGVFFYFTYYKARAMYDSLMDEQATTPIIEMRTAEQIKESEQNKQELQEIDLEMSF